MGAMTNEGPVYPEANHAERGTTVHDWMLSFRLNEVRKLPRNCTLHGLNDYARRWRWCFVLVGNDKIRRVR